MNCQFVVVGGGIAGVSCAEELSRLCPDSTIHLVSGSPLIKAVTNFTKLSRALEQFDVEEKPVSYLAQLCPNVKVHQAKLLSINVACRTAMLSDNDVLKYDKICLCTGATPALIAENNPLVLGIRDVGSVREFQKKIRDARRVMVVGNGGIATELVYEIGGCEVIWAIKHHSIGNTFFDEGAATFFLPHLVSETSELKGKMAGKEEEVLEVSPLKRTRYGMEKKLGLEEQRVTELGGRSEEVVGGALGPDWHSDLTIAGKAFDEKFRHVHVEYKCEMKEILTPEEFKVRGMTLTPFPRKTKTRTDTTSSKGPHTGSDDVTSCEEGWAVYVMLTSGAVFGCDLVVSATGVIPNAGGVAVTGERLALAEDGGVRVDREMRTSLPGVYAAGDVCSAQWDNHSNVWFQMRLWTQARQMGAYVAQCMETHSRGSTTTLDFCFELFSHVTTFFGYKVVLLGLYNGQTLDKDYNIQLRCTKGLEYIKVVLKEGRMVGAVLIGETDLEETFENLILNKMDLSQFDLLDPSVDLEDFFD